jgi:hypothetical protein
MIESAKDVIRRTVTEITKDLAHKINSDLINKVTPFLTPAQIRQIQRILIAHGVVKRF